MTCWAYFGRFVAIRDECFGEGMSFGQNMHMNMAERLVYNRSPSNVVLCTILRLHGRVWGSQFQTFGIFVGVRIFNDNPSKGSI